jgi:hypothetical protein
VAKRMRAKLREIKEQLKATRHDGIETQRPNLSYAAQEMAALYQSSLTQTQQTQEGDFRIG